MDINKDKQQEVEGVTKQVAPVEPAAEPTKRRRRTERFAGLIDEKDSLPVEEQPSAAAPEQPVRLTPMRPASRPVQSPSQGVPRPAALRNRETAGAVEPAKAPPVPIVRRKAEDGEYTPMQQHRTPSVRDAQSQPEPFTVRRPEVRPSREPDQERKPVAVPQQPAAPQQEGQVQMRQNGTIARRPVPVREPQETDKQQTAQFQRERPMPAPRRLEETPEKERAVQVPSQGIPQPAALKNQDNQKKSQPEQNGSAVRRPVKAEGYTPLQQLGNNSSRARRPEDRPSPLDEPRRARNPETEHIAYADDVQEESKGGRGLIAVIIALLVVAALILGLMMIPEDNEGFLGDIKRAVTAPVKGLFAGDEEDSKTPATAEGFTATISQATSPYKVVFHMVTSTNVTAVRVVDAAGNVMPTVTTLSAPNSESTIVWMFEMTREEGFDGIVTAQIQSGESWNDTGLTQQLILGSAVPVVSDVPVSQPSATAVPTLEPTDVPEVTPELPPVTPTPTMSVTATPTMSVTATPTVRPAATMAPEAAVEVEATPVPAEEPVLEIEEETTPVPTEEPAVEPTAEPTPAATPKLEAMAVESADPKIITEQVIYKDNSKAATYEREKPMNMPAGDDYLTRAFGVTTFRGNAFRQNAAVDTVSNAESLSLAWTVEASSVAGASRNYYGIGWTNQPVIAKWPSDVRKSMALEQARKDQKNMKEVIVTGMDGKIYFLDLEDGSATRETINFGFPMRSTPSLHPLSYPMMTSGQYARKMKSGTSSKIGLYYYNLMDQKQLRMIDGIDRQLKRTYSENASGAFDTSALIDRNTNTLITIGTNGLLYTEKLAMSMMLDAETNTLKYEFDEPAEVVTLMSHTKGQKATAVGVESSLAMYANYAFYADMDGVLRCVDTTTMTTAWAVDTGDSVRAAIALDLEEGEQSNTLWLYTANLLNSRTKGDVTIRRFNAMTGEEDWGYSIHCTQAKKRDVTFNAIATPGAMASPVIGQNSLSELVYFTLSSVSTTGAKELGGEGSMPGVIIALNKATGEVAWHMAMEAYCYSSPVAVYDENGNGWIIQACSNGTIYLLDGLTGKTVNTLAVNGVIEASPAVYGDMMVIGTTGKDTSYIYGIKIN